MSKADKMFEKLGYKIEEDEDSVLIYQTNIAEVIIYKVILYKKCTDEKFRIKLYEQYITLKFLQAINEKCKELGWLDVK